jgi:hypothetical protein
VFDQNMLPRGTENGLLSLAQGQEDETNETLSSALSSSSSLVAPKFPLFLKGFVIHGFGRGSKELGIPTANLPIDNYEKELENYPVGVYYGYGYVHSRDGQQVHKVAMSIGWNPYYKNTTKTIEAHIIHTYESDFYGEEMRILVLGYIRPERDFPSLDALITAIHEDIEFTKKVLDYEENLKYKNHPFFWSKGNDEHKESNKEETNI